MRAYRHLPPYPQKALIYGVFFHLGAKRLPLHTVVYHLYCYHAAATVLALQLPVGCSSALGGDPTVDVNLDQLVSLGLQGIITSSREAQDSNDRNGFQKPSSYLLAAQAEHSTYRLWLSSCCKGSPLGGRFRGPRGLEVSPLVLPSPECNLLRCSPNRFELTLRLQIGHWLVRTFFLR